LDDRNAARPREREEAGDVAGLAGEGDRQDRAGAGPGRPSPGVAAGGQGLGPRVGEDRGPRRAGGGVAGGRPGTRPRSPPSRRAGGGGGGRRGRWGGGGGGETGRAGLAAT